MSILLRGSCRALVFALALVALPRVAFAGEQGPVTVRAGDHGTFGRLVFDFPSTTKFRVVREGDTVTLRFRPSASLDLPAHPPRNIRALRPGDDGVSLELATGARLRQSWSGHHLIVDVEDAASRPSDRRPSAPKAEDPRLPAVTRKGVVGGRPLPAMTEVLLPLPPILPPPAPIAVPKHNARPQAASAPPVLAPIALRAAAASSGEPGAAFSVPFDPDTGAAAFRRGAFGYVVFGQAKPVDLSPLRDNPVLGAASMTLLTDATVIRLPLQQPASLSLTRTDGGWTVAVTDRPPAIQPIMPGAASGALALPDSAAARVVTITDPETGALLLVGTQRTAGPAVAVRRRMPAFTLAATWQGVVVEPLSDRLALAASKTGFVLTSADPHDVALAADGEALGGAAALTRRFDFPADAAPVLMRSLDARIREAALAPPLARGRKRREVGRAMIALGMGAEAQAVLRLAGDADPRLLHDPDTTGLAAIAALLAGRVNASAGIDDPALGDSDEVAFWRAVRAAALHDDARAAPVFAATYPLMLSYPPTLRDRLLPMVAETLAAHGEAKAADALLAGRRDDPRLAMARAILMQEQGQTDAALVLYGQLAGGTDRLLRVRAATRATELRLVSGRISPAEAANRLSKLLFAWRGDDRDLHLRLRVADLRQQAGQWQAALAMLRDTATVFPDSPEPRAHLRRTFAAMLHGPGAASLSPLAFVTIAEQSTDLLPDGPDGDALADALADRLDALDLPARSAKILAKLMDAAASGPRRAEFGLRLARADLALDDAAGALAALAASGPAAADPPGLDEQRAEAFARAKDTLGDKPAAIAALVPFADGPADLLRADFLSAARDWPGTAAALGEAVRATLSAVGAISAPQRDMLVRLAAAEVRAGDAPGLARLRSEYGARMADGTGSSMFRLLTEPPATSIGDLPRVLRETSSAATLASR